MTPGTLVYLAISPALTAELELDEQLARIEPHATLERWPGPDTPPLAAVEDALRRAQVVITGWGTPTLTVLKDWTPELFAVRLLVHSAGTVKYFLPVEAIERGLIVVHANEALAAAVAEFTLGAVIFGRRLVVQAAARMKSGQPLLPLPQMHETAGSTIGVIGASAIGRRVLRLLEPLGVTLLLYDPYCQPETARSLGAELVGLDELMRRSDVVTLHAPVTSETLGMLGAEQFSAMKDGALFINTARGRLIDQQALLEELRSGRFWALLDVTDPTEPLPLDSPFFELENCVVLPHMAAVTVETRRRQAAQTVGEVLRYLAGEPLEHQVSRVRWDTMA